MRGQERSKSPVLPSYLYQGINPRKRASNPYGQVKARVDSNTRTTKHRKRGNENIYQNAPKTDRSTSTRSLQFHNPFRKDLTMFNFNLSGESGDLESSRGEQERYQYEKNIRERDFKLSPSFTPEIPTYEGEIQEEKQGESLEKSLESLDAHTKKELMNLLQGADRNTSRNLHSSQNIYPHSQHIHSQTYSHIPSAERGYEAEKEEMNHYITQIRRGEGPSRNASQDMHAFTYASPHTPFNQQPIPEPSLYQIVQNARHRNGTHIRNMSTLDTNLTVASSGSPPRGESKESHPSKLYPSTFTSPLHSHRGSNWRLPMGNNSQHKMHPHSQSMSHVNVNVNNPNVNNPNGMKEGDMNAETKSVEKEDMHMLVHATIGLSEQVKDLGFKVEDMQITLNERETEIMRLGLFLSDERKHSSTSTKMQRDSSQKSLGGGNIYGHRGLPLPTPVQNSSQHSPRSCTHLNPEHKYHPSKVIGVGISPSPSTSSLGIRHPILIHRKVQTQEMGINRIDYEKIEGELEEEIRRLRVEVKEGGEKIGDLERREKGVREEWDITNNKQLERILELETKNESKDRELGILRVRIKELGECKEEKRIRYEQEIRVKDVEIEELKRGIGTHNQTVQRALNVHKGNEELARNNLALKAQLRKLADEMEVLRGGRLNASQSPLIRLEGKGSGGELELRNTHLELNVKDLNNTINEMADKLKSQADYIRTIKESGGQSPHSPKGNSKQMGQLTQELQEIRSKYENTRVSLKESESKFKRLETQEGELQEKRHEYEELLKDYNELKETYGNDTQVNELYEQINGYAKELEEKEESIEKKERIITTLNNSMEAKEKNILNMQQKLLLSAQKQGEFQTQIMELTNKCQELAKERDAAAINNKKPKKDKGKK